MNKIKIVSDGLPKNTRVYVVDEDGKQIAELDMLRSVRWDMGDPTSLAVATIEVLKPEVELTAAGEDVVINGLWLPTKADVS